MGREGRGSLSENTSVWTSTLEDALIDCAALWGPGGTRKHPLDTLLPGSGFPEMTDSETFLRTGPVSSVRTRRCPRSFLHLPRLPTPGPRSKGTTAKQKGHSHPTLQGLHGCDQLLVSPGPRVGGVSPQLLQSPEARASWEQGRLSLSFPVFVLCPWRHLMLVGRSLLCPGFLPVRVGPH